MSFAWQDVRVLITGADGFMGSHLTERLLALGASVDAFVRYDSRACLGARHLSNLSGSAGALGEVLWGDLAAPDAADAIVAREPQVIFHLAADAWVPRSFTSPRDVVTSNVASTLNVLHAARQLRGLHRVVITSSSEIYGTARTERIAEDHPLEPTSPYAASKVACDRLAISWWRTFETPVSIIRPFNTFGPRHLYDVIPKFIRLALAGAPLTVHGSGLQSRDFTYVDDMVDAFLVMGAHEAAVGRAVNFGTGLATTVLDVAERIREVTGSRSKIVHTPERAAEVERLCCDPSLAARLFDWRAGVHLDEGLRLNVQWATEAWT